MATFGNHPDQSTDFGCEIERLEGWIEDIRAGLRSQWPFWTRLSRLLAFNRSAEADTLDEIAQRARPIVAGLERRAIAALRGEPAP